MFGDLFFRPPRSDCGPAGSSLRAPPGAHAPPSSARLTPGAPHPSGEGFGYPGPGGELQGGMDE